MARRGPDQEAAELAPRGGADLVPDAFEQRPDRAFEKLQADVAGEAVADDDVAGVAQQIAALGVAAEVEVGRDEQRVGLERELVALLRLLADREQADPGRAIRAAPPRRSRPSGRTGAGARAVRRRSRRRRGDRGAERAGMTTAIAGRSTSGRRRMWKSPPRAAPVFPADTTASASPVADGSAGGDERAVRLRADRFDGLLVHRDRIRRLDELQPVRLEVGRPVDHGLDLPRRGLEAPATISSGARSPPMASTATRTGSQATEPESGAARLRARGRSCSSGRRGAGAWAVADRALVHARRFEAMRPAACRGAPWSVFAWGLP